MIRYTLACDSGHQFESWFPSGGAYDEQEERGLISCPICESTKVCKTLMAPALARAVATTSTPSSASTETAPMNGEAERHMRSMLRAMHSHIRRTASDVGQRFAVEVRAMHYGEAPHRAIHGAASFDEAKALIDEGIDICPLPPMPDDQN